jgi:hypothetical protein
MTIIDMRPYDQGFKFWLSGLADGESSFVIAMDCRKSRLGTPKFAWTITLRADDKPVLQLVHGYTGGLLSKIPKPKKTAGNPSYLLQVCTIAGCLRLADHFEAFPLRSKKLRDFEIWNRALRLWCSISHGRQRPILLRERVSALSRQLRAEHIFVDPDFTFREVG